MHASMLHGCVSHSSYEGTGEGPNVAKVKEALKKETLKK